MPAGGRTAGERHRNVLLHMGIVRRVLPASTQGALGLPGQNDGAHQVDPVMGLSGIVGEHLGQLRHRLPGVAVVGSQAMARCQDSKARRSRSWRWRKVGPSWATTALTSGSESWSISPGRVRQGPVQPGQAIRQGTSWGSTRVCSGSAASPGGAASSSTSAVPATLCEGLKAVTARVSTR